MRCKKLYESPDVVLIEVFDSDCISMSESIDTGADGGALYEDGFGNNWLG